MTQSNQIEECDCFNKTALVKMCFMQKHTQAGPQIQLSFFLTITVLVLINLSNYQPISQLPNYQPATRIKSGILLHSITQDMDTIKAVEITVIISGVL